MGQAAPSHPLISIMNYGEARFDPKDFEEGIILNFYKISFKTSFSGKLKYGQGFYDFEEGGMSFIAPGQLLKMQDEEADYSGMTLHIHPDFLRSYPLNSAIKQYGYFSYSAAEALYLSEKEKATILSIYRFIQDELNERIDKFSQDVIISQIELLLNYANRFYDRQFLTRKAVNNDLLVRLEQQLEDYFKDDKLLTGGLPSVATLAENLHVTRRYLSDLLRNLIGLNAQQFIHEKVIEKAKEYLAKNDLTVAQIAYHLGFEHPQSFNKLFKSKTSLSPSGYKKSLRN
ncbi:helix-turn-helix domain-containing protein [Olivibacter sp. LS-1]|nr:helix-turn-helix domain-containing protein [Olivibacter sp. LS-1]